MRGQGGGQGLLGELGVCVLVEVHVCEVYV